MLLSFVASFFLLQAAPDPAAAASVPALPICDAALPAAAPCSLFGEAPSTPDDCETPSWRRRAACAVVAAVLIAEDVRAGGVDCEEAVQTHDVDLCLQMEAMWEGARMESYFEEALITAYQDATMALDVAADGGVANPYSFTFVVDLGETQEMWEAYTARVCGSVGEQYFGGTMRISAMNACHAEMTRERTRALWAYSLAGLQGELPAPSASVTDADIQAMLVRHSVDRDRVLSSRPVEQPAH